MMGPWLVFAGLLNRAAIALYEGGPVERGFCEFVGDAQVTVLGVVPSIVRGWRRAGCAEGVDWSAIRLFSSSGEASDPDDYTYLMRLGGPEGESRPVIEYCGGSELAGGYVASTLLAPNCPSEFNAKMMGTDFVVLGPSGHPCRPGEVGEVFLIPPAIGMTTRLLNQDNEEVYYAGCPERNGMRLRRHGDLMLVLGDGRYRSLGRADDTMNLGGIKTSSAEIEQAVARTPGVVEAAAVGVPPPKGGPDRLVLFVVAPGQAPGDLAVALQRDIRDRANPLFHLHDIVAVDALPRTASNKLLRRELRKRYQEEEAAEPRAN
jgi:acetyl-CoA synthetase